MKNVFAFLTLAAALIAPSHAAVVYTSQTTFATKIARGQYTEAFTAATVNSPTKNFTNGTYSYTISTGSGAPGLARYTTLDNFVVGRAVPEPGTMAIMAVGLAGLFAARRRRSA